MNRLRLVGLMLQPSVSSMIMVLLLSMILVAGTILRSASKSTAFYEYLVGDSLSGSSLFDTSRYGVQSFTAIVFGNPTLNKILFVSLWLLVGLFVYLIVSGMSSGMQEISKTIDAAHVSGNKKRYIMNDFKLRIIIVTVSLIGTIFYWLFFLRVLLPFGLLASTIAAPQLNSLTGFLYSLLGFSVLAISLHIHIVLLRVLLLRPRLFGGGDDMLVAELDH